MELRSDSMMSTVARAGVPRSNRVREAQFEAPFSFLGFCLLAKAPLHGRAPTPLHVGAPKKGWGSVWAIKKSVGRPFLVVR